MGSSRGAAEFVASRADPAIADEASPYPGGRPHPVVPEHVRQDSGRLERLFRDTAAALPSKAGTEGARTGEAC